MVEIFMVYTLMFVCLIIGLEGISRKIIEKCRKIREGE